MTRKKQCCRCGTCCKGYIKGKVVNCPYLEELPNGKTNCKVYNNRLGKIIMKDEKGRFGLCGRRQEQYVSFPNCSLNKEGIKCQ